MKLLTFSFGLAAALGAACAVSGNAEEHGRAEYTFKSGRVYHLLKSLPLDAASYQPETAALVTAGIPEKYGPEEWAAVVLTNEIHQHVGIYNVIGAKMGVRAREILEAPARAVNVTVETGCKPPVSCLIDGLQVALGSTFAQDLIHAPACETPRAAAVFEYGNRKIRLSLNPEAESQVAEWIAKAVQECGNLTPAYFERIEEYSYRVWATFDRNAIFKVETMP